MINKQMNKKCSNAMEYQSIGFHYAPVWNCKCSWRSSWTVNLVNALDGAGERWTSWTLLTEPVNGDGEPREPCERMYSNWVRVVFEPVSNTISKKIFLWMGLIRSNPVRSVRMQWSISLLVSTTPPSGFVNDKYIFTHPYSHKKCWIVSQQPSTMLN